jgi:hypothetical protein
MMLPLALPPDSTTSNPPLLTAVPLAVPPAEMYSAPLDNTCVALVTPPLCTVSKPPPLTVALIVVPKTTRKSPLLTVAELTVEPEETTVWVMGVPPYVPLYQSAAGRKQGKSRRCTAGSLR